MNIRKEDYQEILAHLVKKRWEGEEFVAFYEGALPVTAQELFTFQTQYDVCEFCYEMSTDLDTYTYLSIRSAIRSMEEALRDETLLIERNGIVDVELMVSLRYQRMEKEQLNNNQNNQIMNEENYDYLSKQVKFTGFGEGLAEALKKEIVKEQETFILTHEPEFGNGDVKATLHFRRSEETGMVFFNKYDLEVKQAADTMTQTFFVGKENSFTLKEAFNLMEGRAVYKELEKLQKVGETYEGTGEKYTAWVQLDFAEAETNGNFKQKRFHDNYGFDLHDAISKLPIRELDDADKKSQMIRSLERGNQHAVTYVKDGEDHKGSIVAIPQFKTVKLFDEKGKEIRQGHEKKQENKLDQNQSKKQGQKTGQKTGNETKVPRKRNQGQRMG